jgi:phenylalanyl-tRNA synthetase beta chain
MRVPLRWLAEFVALPAEPADLIDRLTRAGLECGGVATFGVPAPAGVRVKPTDATPVWDRDKVLVADVLAIDKHPDADKLKLVKLQYGAADPKTVVTGAPNVAVGTSGQRVVLGLRGSRYRLADKDGNVSVVSLEPKALRGIPNDAMCMSDFELGLSDDHDGIILLDADDPPPGTPAQDVLGDVVLDLDVLPNMARCLAVVGVAREVAALTGATVREPDTSHPTADEPAAGKVTVTTADPALCPRYSATIVRNVTVGPAPRWMRSRLRLAGMRPINAVVDVTNYVMLELGQPLHAFDFDKLVGRAGGGVPAITVRPAAAGETLKTLDGQVRELVPTDLVIADAAGPVALAGVMGGFDTEVTDATRTVLLEAAAFDPVSVRKTARRLNLFSEASGRFSRGVPAAGVPTAAARAARLLHRHAGGTVLAGVVEAYPHPQPPRVVELHRSEIERILGVGLPDGEVERVLTALQFTLEETLWGWAVTVPPTRLDIQSGPADLIEELARVSGYDRLPDRLLAQELPPPAADPALDFEERVKDLLAAAGLTECVSYSLTSEGFGVWGLGFGLQPAPDTPDGPGAKPQTPNPKPCVRLVNPVSPERAVLRTSLLPGLLEAAARNLKGDAGVALFEVGPVFLPAGELPDEPPRLAVLLCGARAEAAWDDPVGTTPPAFDFFDLKGRLAGLAADLGVEVAAEPARDVPHLHPGRSARLTAGGTVLGTFGELHPTAAAAFDLADRAVLVAELDLGALRAAVPARVPYRPFSGFPPVLRDVAVVVPADTPAADVEREVIAGGGELLESARLFDVYAGDRIPAGTKSLAFALTYRVADRQLADKEVDKAHQKLEGRLRHVLKAQIRGKDGV